MKKLTFFLCIVFAQVLDMAAVLEVVTILERLPITKEALEVKLKVLYSSRYVNYRSSSTVVGRFSLVYKIRD